MLAKYEVEEDLVMAGSLDVELLGIEVADPQHVADRLRARGLCPGAVGNRVRCPLVQGPPACGDGIGEGVDVAGTVQDAWAESVSVRLACGDQEGDGAVCACLLRLEMLRHGVALVIEIADDLDGGAVAAAYGLARAGPDLCEQGWKEERQGAPSFDVFGQYLEGRRELGR